jgi:hypothetical protein
MSAALRLLLLAAWLLVGQGAIAPRTASAQARAQLGAAAAKRVDTAALPALSALPRVAPAPVLERVPIELATLPRMPPAWAPASFAKPRDLRLELRRAQTRRRVPRLGSEEPPWSA